MMVNEDEAALSLFSFAIGVELAQLLIVLGVVLVHTLVAQNQNGYVTGNVERPLLYS